MNGEKTQRELIQEIWHGMYGVPSTDDNGIYGDLKLVCQKVCKNEKRITKLEITLATLIATLVGAGILNATQIINLF